MVHSPARLAVARKAFGALLREPILHFLVLGLGLFFLSSFLDRDPGQTDIVVSDADIERMRNTFQQQFQTPPSPTQLSALIENHIREEIFWREGAALGLDQGDEIVRRRVAQKYEYLYENLMGLEQPDVPELEQYYRENIEKYTQPARVSFSHRYFSPDRAGAADAARRANAALVELRQSKDEHGAGDADVFPGPDEIATLDEDELSRIFGRSEIIKAAFAATQGVWSGPYQSGYGMHLMRVSSKTDPEPMAFESVREKVAADFLEDRRRALNTESYAALRGKYHISIEDHPE